MPRGLGALLGYGRLLFLHDTTILQEERKEGTALGGAGAEEMAGRHDFLIG